MLERDIESEEVIGVICNGHRSDTYGGRVKVVHDDITVIIAVADYNTIVTAWREEE